MSEKLIHLPVSEYDARLDSDAPTPGGGSSAALSGMLGSPQPACLPT